jgi:hypothetical protein
MSGAKPSKRKRRRADWAPPLAAQKKAPAKIYQLKATIVGTKPPVWRRLLVPSSMTLSQLHEELQLAFGWWDCHLHEFEVDGTRYGKDGGAGGGPPLKSERYARLAGIVQTGSKFIYVYDFGDDWRHELVVEEELDPVPGMRYPICSEGGRACPPEDCGGVWGYAHLLEVLDDPAHPEHRSTVAWAEGRFDPDRFEPPG